MKLNRRKQDQITPPKAENNPFFTGSKPEPVVIELDLTAKPDALLNYKPYIKAISNAALDFPWFGDFLIAKKGVIEEGLKHKTNESVRRVLISYLAGRPMTAVAKRIPTSRRNAYSIINMAIYDWYGGVDNWTRIGLVRVWDIPETSFPIPIVPYDLDYLPDSTPVICLLCHRLIGHIALEERNYDSTLVDGDDRRLWSAEINLDRIRGHLISHFYLGSRPTPNERRHLRLKIFQVNDHGELPSVG